MSKVGTRSVDNRKPNQGVIDSMKAAEEANKKNEERLKIEEDRAAGKITNEEANKRAAKAEADQLENEEWKKVQKAAENYSKDKNRLGRLLNNDGGILNPPERSHKNEGKKLARQFFEIAKKDNFFDLYGRSDKVGFGLGSDTVKRAKQEGKFDNLPWKEKEKLEDEIWANAIRPYNEEIKKLVSKELEGTRNESLLLGSKNKGINIFQDESFNELQRTNRLMTEGDTTDLWSYDRTRSSRQEGGMADEQVGQLVGAEEATAPIDTYPNVAPEDMASVEASQLPDEQMEDDYLDFIVDEALIEEEQTYLMNALEADPQLSVIFDKLIGVASEFSGAGEVEGPGTGVSDSIPARLSDGEFVMTRKATDAIGADNLQAMMDEGERAYDFDGGESIRMAFGGAVEDKDELEDSKNYLSKTDEEIRKVMIGSNRMPSVR